MNNTPFTWEHFSDGSGGMRTALGHSFYSYDKQTDEIFYPNGRVLGLYGDWKANAEKDYLENVLAKEERYTQLLSEGIYAPYFCGWHLDRQYQNSDYILITEDHVLSREYFCSIWTRMCALDDKNFKSRATTVKDAAGKIGQAIKNCENANTPFITMHYENEDIVIDLNELKPLSELISEREEKEL